MTTIGSVSHVTEDLINEILLRLPVIALLRFKSVCKKWLSIISGPRFAFDHFHMPSNRTYPLVCCAQLLNRPLPIEQHYLIYSVLLFPTKTLERHVDLDMGIFPTAITDVCGPSNGIICVRFEDRNLALWNPATRKLWSLPADIQPPRDPYQYSFWVDLLTNEFKIFLIKSGREHDSWRTRHDFLMYTSCDDSWRCFEGEEALLHFSDIVPHFQWYRYTVSNGFYYFLKINMWAQYYVIVAFDHFNHLFQEIQMPSKIDCHRRRVYLDLYDDDSLALFSVGRDFPGDAEKQSVVIWLMKEKGCWTKLFNVVQRDYVEKPVGFWKRNEVFINGINELMIYDTLSGKTRKLEVGTPANVASSHFSPFCYKESLFSLKI